MISNLQEIFSNAAKGMKRSAIRELLKLAQNPEIISFAAVIPLYNLYDYPVFVTLNPLSG